MERRYRLVGSAALPRALDSIGANDKSSSIGSEEPPVYAWTAVVPTSLKSAIHGAESICGKCLSASPSGATNGWLKAFASSAVSDPSFGGTGALSATNHVPRTPYLIERGEP